jgi:hypothetical protein
LPHQFPVSDPLRSWRTGQNRLVAILADRDQRSCVWARRARWSIFVIQALPTEMLPAEKGQLLPVDIDP